MKRGQVYRFVDKRLRTSVDALEQEFGYIRQFKPATMEAMPQSFFEELYSAAERVRKLTTLPILKECEREAQEYRERSARMEQQKAEYFAGKKIRLVK